MNKALANEDRLTYTAPEIAIDRLAKIDIITASGPDDGFWGEEHEFIGAYDVCEW